MYRTKCLIPSDEAFDSFGRGVYHYTKTTCFGVKSMALYGDRKAFYDTKTTCFAVVEVVAYRTRAVCLLLVPSLLITWNFIFWKFAATLPHTTQKSFVQSVCRAVAAKDNQDKLIRKNSNTFGFSLAYSYLSPLVKLLWPKGAECGVAMAAHRK